MKKISIISTILLLCIQGLKAQPKAQLYVDGEKFTGQSFQKTSVIEVGIINDNTENEYRIDKISIEVRLESGSPKTFFYKKQKVWAYQQSENRPKKSHRVNVYPTRWEQSPVKEIKLSDFDNLSDLCVSRIIVQIQKASFRNQNSFKEKRVSSSIIDYSETYSIWADWSCND